jgi:hypothetical protein
MSKTKNKGKYHSFIRVQQAVDLVDRISQDGLGTSEYLVLIRLGVMMARQDDPKNPRTLKDTCYPSIKYLSGKTLLAERTVRNALTKLITFGYITKERLPGTSPRGGKYAGNWEHNRYALVPAVWGAATIGSDTEPPSSADPAPPLTKPAVPERQITNREIFNDVPEHTPVISATTPKDSASVVAAKTDTTYEKIFEYLKATLGANKNFSTKDGVGHIETAICKCIKTSGSGSMCLEILKWVFVQNKGDALERTRESKLLGGYLVKCFTGWKDNYLSEHEDESEEEDEDESDYVEEDDEEEQKSEEEDEGEVEVDADHSLSEWEKRRYLSENEKKWFNWWLDAICKNGNVGWDEHIVHQKVEFKGWLIKKLSPLDLEITEGVDSDGDPTLSVELPQEYKDARALERPLEEDEQRIARESLAKRKGDRRQQRLKKEDDKKRDEDDQKRDEARRKAFGQRMDEERKAREVRVVEA